MRTLLAILLLAIFGLGSAAPLLALSGPSQSHLAACCRRDGAHHCAMGMAERTGVADAPAQAPEPAWRAPVRHCPFCPAPASGTHGHDPLGLHTHSQPLATLYSHPTGPVQAASRLRIARERTRQKRGPPTLFA